MATKKATSTPKRSPGVRAAPPASSAKTRAPAASVKPAAKAARRATAATPDIGQLVAETAYYMAERRGFAPGGELADWVAAERMVAEQLGRATPRA